MRKSQVVNSIVFVSIIYIASMMYLAANYDKYLNWLLVKENITMLCFGFISVLSLVITLLSFKLKKTTSSRDYYAEEMHKYQCKEWEKETKKNITKKRK